MPMYVGEDDLVLGRREGSFHRPLRDEFRVGSCNGRRDGHRQLVADSGLFETAGNLQRVYHVRHATTVAPGPYPRKYKFLCDLTTFGT